jgi:hypothetical protein
MCAESLCLYRVVLTAAAVEQLDNAGPASSHDFIQASYTGADDTSCLDIKTESRCTALLLLLLLAA